MLLAAPTTAVPACRVGLLPGSASLPPGGIRAQACHLRFYRACQSGLFLMCAMASSRSFFAVIPSLGPFR